MLGKKLIFIGLPEAVRASERLREWVWGCS
jgi:hypothetical protein